MITQILLSIKLLYKSLMEIYGDTTDDKSFSGTNFNSINWGLILLLVLSVALVIVLGGKVIHYINYIDTLENRNIGIKTDE